MFLIMIEQISCFYLQSNVIRLEEIRKRMLEKILGSKLYVRNLDYSTTNEQLEELFSIRESIKLNL